MPGMHVMMRILADQLESSAPVGKCALNKKRPDNPGDSDRSHDCKEEEASKNFIKQRSL